MFETTTEMRVKKVLFSDFVKKIMNTIYGESLRIQDTIQTKK